MNLKTLIFPLVVGLSIVGSLSANPARPDEREGGAKSEASQARRERARQQEVGLRAIADTTSEPRSPKLHIKLAAHLSAQALGYVAEGRDKVANQLARQALRQLELAEKKFPSDSPELAIIAQMRETIFTDILSGAEAQFQAMAAISTGSSSAMADSAE